MTHTKRVALVAGLAVAVLVATGPTFAQGVMFVKNNRVGIGTSTPAEELHVFRSDEKTFILAENTGAGADGVAVLRAKSNTATINFQAHGSGRTIARFGKTLGSWAEFLSVGGNGLIVGSINGPFVLGANNSMSLELNTDGSWTTGTGATLTAGGTWTNASSREYKQDIHELTAEESLAVFAQLQPVKFRYKASPDEEQLGFIAEDVPDLVAIDGRTGLSSMDIVAVLTKVVQEQSEIIEDLSQRLEKLEAN